MTEKECPRVNAFRFITAAQDEFLRLYAGRWQKAAAYAYNNVRQTHTESAEERHSLVNTAVQPSAHFAPVAPPSHDSRRCSSLPCPARRHPVASRVCHVSFAASCWTLTGISGDLSIAHSRCAVVCYAFRLMSGLQIRAGPSDG